MRVGLEVRVCDKVAPANDEVYTMEALTTEDRRLATGLRLAFCFRLQFHFAVLHFDGIFDRFATVLFADLFGLLLHE
jgi:hypothetical protein